MRIVMIWSENLNKAGSGRTHFVHLAAALARRGHDVRIVAPGYRPRTTEPLLVPVSYLPVGRRSVVSFLWFHVLLAVCLPWIILKRRPDAIYARGLFHSFLISLECRVLGVRYVAEIDSIVDEELAMRGRGGLARLIRFFDRWNLRRASAFVCVTPKLRDELVRRGARADRVHAIHNGAAAEMFAPGDRAAARAALSLAPDVPLVGFAGTLAAWQGLDLLVEAAARLPGDSPCRVLIVGDGEMRGDLLRQVEEQGLGERVQLMAEVPHERVAELLRAIDVVVIPIHDDRKLRYGLSALKFWEALAAGLPVLVPDAADLGDVLRDLDWPGEFRAGDADSLAGAITETVAQLARLRARRDEIHERIRREHSWDAVAERTESLLAGLCGKAGQGGAST